MGDSEAIALLHIFPSFALGGQQMRLAAIASAPGPFRHKIISLDGDLSASNAFPGVDVASLPLRKSSFVSPANIRRLQDLLEATNPDVLCTYNFGTIEAVLANALRRKRAHIHHEDGFGADETIARQKWRRVLMRSLLLREAFVVVPSCTLENVARRQWGIPPNAVKRIPNGIDVERFSCHGRSYGEDLVVGSVGALRPEKNLGLLIRALLSLPNTPRIKLAIIGDGPERDKLIAMAGSHEGIEFRGSTSEPEKAYRTLDIFVLSSNTEQMPLSLMEAMACGLPVVATDVGDIREMLAPENRKFVVRPGDERALRAALQTLINDASLRRRLSAANMEKARREFAMGAMIAAHQALYQRAVESMRP